MPRRCPIVTSSTASTVPTVSPIPLTRVAGWKSSLPARKPCRPSTLPMKQTSWLSGLAAVRSPKPARVRPHVGLGHLPHREEHPAELGLAQHGQHVRLVLVEVGPPAQAERGPACDPGVVARGQPVEAQAVRPRQQPVELDGPVALDAGIGRPSPCVRLHVGRHHVPVELLGQVEDVVLDTKLLGYPPGVIDVGHRAASRVGGASPQLERGPHDVVPLLDQERGGHRGVHPARHRHQHAHPTSVPSRCAISICHADVRDRAATRRPPPARRPGRAQYRPRWCRAPG